jgi:hypothetical protein
MDEHAYKAALRFVQSLDRAVDPESFSDDDAWAVVSDLFTEYVTTGRHLNPAQIAALRDFGHTVGIKPGGALASYRPFVEEALGPSPLDDDALERFFQWVYGQMNANFEMKVPDKVTLDAEPRGPVPPPRKPLW